MFAQRDAQALQKSFALFIDTRLKIKGWVTFQKATHPFLVVATKGFLIQNKKYIFF